ncbi:MAG: sensor histidine kinase [Lachnospiraceae bacterium]|nr:sensor histidine kinase [Lachnospiraceae bacterium]
MSKNTLSEIQKECSIQEMDRKRIARELHDTSLQTLAHLGHQIELASLYIDSDPTNAKLELAVVRQELNDVIDEIRKTIFDLRPMAFDDLGLKECILRFLDSVTLESDFMIRKRIDSSLNFDEYESLTIFRILQECFSNIKKHAKCKNVDLSILDDANGLLIKVMDDGVGFDTDCPYDEQNHYGLSILKERVASLGGQFVICSGDNGGTSVTVRIPK